MSIEEILNSEETYLVVEEVSATLRLSDVTVRRLCKDKVIPNTRIGITYRIPRLPFIKYLKENSSFDINDL